MMSTDSATAFELSSPSQVREWLSKHYRRQLNLLDKFLLQLSRHSASRVLVTRQTVDILRSLIGSIKWHCIAQLLIFLRGVGRELGLAARDPALTNVVRRILAAVREEAARPAGGSSTTTAGASSILWSLPQHVRSTSSRLPVEWYDSQQREEEKAEYPESYYSDRVNGDLKSSVMEAIDEITCELEDLHKNINDQAAQHIFSDEIIMTTGRSKTVERFLISAHTTKQRKFQVVVAEGSPRKGGHQLAAALIKAGVQATLIPDAAVFAVMSRVNKVVLSAHAVLANGGLVTSSGGQLVALAAKQFAVPVVCTTGIFKLCPRFPHEGQETLNELMNPGQCVSSPVPEGVTVVNPVHDLLPPDLVNLFVTNAGSFQPSFIYRLLAEYYHTDDWSSFD